MSSYRFVGDHIEECEYDSTKNHIWLAWIEGKKCVKSPKKFTGAPVKFQYSIEESINSDAIFNLLIAMDYLNYSMWSQSHEISLETNKFYSRVNILGTRRMSAASSSYYNLCYGNALGKKIEFYPQPTDDMSVIGQTKIIKTTYTSKKLIQSLLSY